MGIAENLQQLKSNLPKHITLVAVSKTKNNKAILEAYNKGHSIFGENKVQELVKKYEELPKDIHWHMIGHLQRNKVKYIAPFIHLIHAVDSVKLLKEIDKRAKQNNRIIDCLLQVHIAQEDTKFGFGLDEIEGLVKDSELYKYVNIKGMMGMASFTNNKTQIKSEFAQLKTLFDSLKNEQINILSIGMSADYELAIKKGSTMIRVGSAIFGAR
ncbi:MAG: YggS family pyridoxal phosphate enzyme [Flavobacteriales bacterium TMED123]|nr:MAG: YggS family pyridoxal phosphate enzyme [Flavobacteriales bacterium TMED123]|tara:strand:+ start:5140 stop:5778 length:639 start_codon:yes stop_codon:yes gene_type:complete